MDANSRVEWNLPTYPSYPGGYGRGQGQQGYGIPGGYQQHYGGEQVKDKSGKNNMMMGVAGGAAAGVIGGAVLANAFGK